MEKPRIQYLDYIKAFAIFCVVWGHSIQHLSKNDYFANPVFEFIYSFHMPLFVIISGYFFKSALKLSFGKLLIKKFSQLILPIITWTLLICLFNVVFRLYVLHHAVSWKWFTTNFTYEYERLFWFFKCLFYCYLISWVGVKLFKNEWVAAGLTVFVFLFILPSPVSAIRFLLPYFWIGVFLQKYLYLIDRYNFKILILTLLAFAAMLCFWKGDYTIYKTPIPQIIDFSNFSFHFDHWQIAVFRFLIGLAGSIFFIMLIKNLSNLSLKVSSVLGIVGRYTMEIYVLQRFILERTTYPLRVSPMNGWVYTLLFTPLVALIVIAVSYFLAKIIERNKILNLCLLGRISKT